MLLFALLSENSVALLFQCQFIKAVFLTCTNKTSIALFQKIAPNVNSANFWNVPIVPDVNSGNFWNAPIVPDVNSGNFWNAPLVVSTFIFRKN